MHMDGSDDGATFTDEKGHTVTRSGIVTKTGQKKFGTASAYNPATTTGYYLSVALGTDGSLTGNFTLEWCAYHSDIGTGNGHVMIGPWSGGLLVRIDNGGFFQMYAVNGGQQFSMTPASAGIVATAWQHYAFTRSGSTCRMFVDGSKVAEWSNTAEFVLTTLILCAEKTSSTVADQLKGYMDEVRLTKGVARYTANFTPPSAPFEL
jgi:hypothetical protein